MVRSLQGESEDPAQCRAHIPPHEKAEALRLGHAAEIPSQSLGKRAADVREHSHNCAGNLVHAGDCGQSDQANEEGILDQILTFFAVLQALELHVQLEKCVAHFVSLVQWNSGPGRRACLNEVPCR